MAEPKVCVSLEAITVEEMIDEATRANIAGADYVEVRFDKLYLNKPEPITMVNDDGEEYSKMPPIEEWGVKDFEEIDVEQARANLKESVCHPLENHLGRYRHSVGGMRGVCRSKRERFTCRSSQGCRGGEGGRRPVAA